MKALAAVAVTLALATQTLAFRPLHDPRRAGRHRGHHRADRPKRGTRAGATAVAMMLGACAAPAAQAARAGGGNREADDVNTQ